MAKACLTGWPDDGRQYEVKKHNNYLTLFTLVVLEELHPLESSGSSYNFVRELGLVRLLIATVVLVHLLVRVLTLACKLLVSCTTRSSPKENGTEIKTIEGN